MYKEFPQPCYLSEAQWKSLKPFVDPIYNWGDPECTVVDCAACKRKERAMSLLLSVMFLVSKGILPYTPTECEAKDVH